MGGFEEALIPSTIHNMQKRTLFLTIIIGLVIAGSVGYVLLYPPKSKTSSTAAPPSQPAQTETPAAKTPNKTPGMYVDYSEAAFKQAASQRRVLFFYAPWCPQCRALDKSIREGQVPSGMTILKVDYDSAASLRQQYGVTLQTTLVEVDSSGKLKHAFVAYNEPSLDAIRRELGE